MRTIHSSRPSMLRSESGNVYILVAFGLIMLMTSIAVAVDMTRAFLVRSKAQSALDAALIGASSIAYRGIPNAELQERANSFLEANFPLGYMGSSFDSFNVAFDADRGTVSGNLAVGFSPAFAQILGADRFDINTSGEVTRVLGKDLEIALALDHTSSMCAPVTCSGAACNNAAPCNGTRANSRIDVLRGGVGIFFDEIRGATDATYDPDSRVLYSYIPFNHDVKINNNVMHNGADYLPNSLGLRQDSAPIINAMTSINIDNEGNTNAAKGLAWAWRSLRRVDRNMFTGTSAHQFMDHPQQVGEPDTIKAIILFTDGANEFTYYGRNFVWTVPGCGPNGCPNPFPDIQNPRGAHDRGNANANANQEALCTAIHAEGIRIFPIVLNQNTASPQLAEIRRINNACAAPAATAYYPTNAEELRETFRQIARQLINLRITQ